MTRVELLLEQIKNCENNLEYWEVRKKELESSLESSKKICSESIVNFDKNHLIKIICHIGLLKTHLNNLERILNKIG